MNQIAPPSHPWKALAATALLLAAAQAAFAGDAGVSRVEVVGQMPMRDACASADADLAEALLGAWDDAAKPSTVAVTFKVQGHAVYDVVPQSDSARTFHQIRRAVHGLRCDGGDALAHSVRFTVRFVDGAQESRVAAIADAVVADPSGR